MPFFSCFAGSGRADRSASFELPRADGAWNAHDVRVTGKLNSTWQNEVMRCEPNDSLDRSQFEEIIQVLRHRMPHWWRNVDLDDEVEQIILRLWFALNGEDSSIERLTPREEALVVEAYYLADIYRDPSHERFSVRDPLRAVIRKLIAEVGGGTGV